MLVKELIAILQEVNPDARIVLCYEHCDSGAKPQCYYKEIEDIGYNQTLVDNKIIIDESTLQIWGE